MVAMSGMPMWISNDYAKGQLEARGSILEIYGRPGTTLG
jgi:hypothetical protein